MTLRRIDGDEDSRRDGALEGTALSVGWVVGVCDGELDGTRVGDRDLKRLGENDTIVDAFPCDDANDVGEGVESLCKSNPIVTPAPTSRQPMSTDPRTKAFLPITIVDSFKASGLSSSSFMLKEEAQGTAMNQMNRLRVTEFRLVLY